MLPIFGAEYTTSSHTATYLASINLDWEFNDTNAPWVKYIASRGLSFGQDLANVLQHTWIAQATDPRDKIFGILGLVQNGAGVQGLAPNYSLSLAHTFIGIVAHLILNLKRVELFLKASVRSSRPSHLSWLPNRDVDDALRHLFQWPTNSSWKFDPRRWSWESGTKSTVEKASANKPQNRPGRQNGRKGYSSTEIGRYEDAQEKQRRNSKADEGEDGEHSDEDRQHWAHDAAFLLSIHTEWPEVWARTMKSNITTKSSKGHDHIDRAPLYFNKYTGTDHDEVDVPWDFQPYIDPNTVELSIHLLHLFTIFTKPIKSSLTSSTCTLSLSGRSCTLYIRTANIPLRWPARLDQTDVFALIDKTSHHVFILFLEKTQTLGAYKLIQCYPCYDLLLKGSLEDGDLERLLPYDYFGHKYPLREVLAGPFLLSILCPWKPKTKRRFWSMTGHSRVLLMESAWKSHEPAALQIDLGSIPILLGLYRSTVMGDEGMDPQPRRLSPQMTIHS